MHYTTIALVKILIELGSHWIPLAWMLDVTKNLYEIIWCPHKLLCNKTISSNKSNYLIILFCNGIPMNTELNGKIFAIYFQSKLFVQWKKKREMKSRNGGKVWRTQNMLLEWLKWKQKKAVEIVFVCVGFVITFAPDDF